MMKRMMVSFYMILASQLFMLSPSFASLSLSCQDLAGKWHGDLDVLKDVDLNIFSSASPFPDVPNARLSAQLGPNRILSPFLSGTCQEEPGGRFSMQLSNHGGNSFSVSVRLIDKNTLSVFSAFEWDSKSIRAFGTLKK
jgi:hypothetical protein